MIQHLGRAARFAAADSPSARIEKLGALFAHRAASDAAAIPLLAELLSIPVSAPAAPLSLTPAQRKAATIALLVDEIVRLGETDPVLLVLEDAHWIDATTLELMTRTDRQHRPGTVARLGDRAAGFRAALAGAAACDAVDAGSLGRAECAQLVAGVAASHGLSAETVAAIVAKTDGVPLFVEELTKSMMESAGEDSAAVPATLKDFADGAARPPRRGARGGADRRRHRPAIRLRAARRGCPKRGAELEAALAKLVAAGNRLSRGTRPGTELQF